MKEKIQQLADYISSSKRIVVFSGAGISCASGIPDFRSSNGLYSQNYNGLSPERIISHSFYKSHPEVFFDFYKSRMIFTEAKPNEAHYFFASLQETKEISIVTQNIDGLHSKAGSKTVFELHGTILDNYCEKCHKKYDLDYILAHKNIPYCRECGGIVRPKVTLYEEQLDEDVINGALSKIIDCDCLIVVGTSLVVQPASAFVSYYRGNKLVLINKDATSYDAKMNLIINDDIVSIIKELKKIGVK